MVTYNGINIVNGNEKIFVGEEKNTVLEKLGVDINELICAKQNISYITLESVVMTETLGKCRLLFSDGKLIKITFTPSLGKYIRKLEKVTRSGIYSCVYKVYQDIKTDLDKSHFDCITNNSMQMAYRANDILIKLTIDSDRENVTVETEAIK
jgi:hypothetical protein